jgi:hypothetical protein
MWQYVWQYRSALLFTFCCVWIIAVSAHDAVLIVVHHEVIAQLERNPLGRRLIEMHDGDVSLFVWVKCGGTAAAGAVLVTLYRYYARVALTAAATLAVFQLLLLCYLHWR